MVAGGGVFVGAALYVAAEPLGALVFGKPQLAGALRIAAFGVPPLALGLLSSQGLRGLKRVREYVFFDLVARFLAAGICLPPALALVRPDHAPVLAFVGGSYLVAAANLMVLRARVRALEAGDEAPAAEPLPHWQAMLAMGLPLLLASSTVYLKGWVDTLMLGVYRTEAEVGVYNVALKLAALASLPLVAVNAIAAPRFAEASAAGEPWRLRRTVEQSGRMILLSSVPIAVALAAAPRLWLGMFGPEAAAGATVLVILCAAYLLSALAGSVGYLLQMIGKQVVFQNITLAVLAISIALNALLVPRYGIEGAAVSTCVGVLLFNGGCVAYLRWHLGFWTIPFMPGGRGPSAPPPDGRPDAPAKV
jgi:O-antigen/teichoic acid export membrane protein